MARALKLCACGCGLPTPPARHDYRSRGIRRGEPLDFIPWHRRPGDLAARLWSKVKKGPRCWIWTGTLMTNGYGVIGHRQRLLLVHRLAWELSHGPIPSGEVIRHRCDVPACVNPRHLQIGSQLDNVRDAVSKGRHAHGTSHPRAKISLRTVEAIRRRARMGESLVAIAQRSGISYSHACAVARGSFWKHLLTPRDAPIRMRVPL